MDLIYGAIGAAVLAIHDEMKEKKEAQKANATTQEQLIRTIQPEHKIFEEDLEQVYPQLCEKMQQANDAGNKVTGDNDQLPVEILVSSTISGILYEGINQSTISKKIEAHDFAMRYCKCESMYTGKLLFEIGGNMVDQVKNLIDLTFTMLITICMQEGITEVASDFISLLADLLNRVEAVICFDHPEVVFSAHLSEISLDKAIATCENIMAEMENEG